MTIPVIPFVNQGGIALLKRFLDQIDNYSVMQIVQRLMLPHIPFMMPVDTDDMMMDDRNNYQCNWSSIPEACDMLCDRMLDLQHVDVPSHVSDLLITVLQLSPPDASILYHLCNLECLKKLFDAAFAEDADHDSVEFPPSPVASVSLAALSVLESLVSRICEALVPPIENVDPIDDGCISSNDTTVIHTESIDRDIDMQILSQLKAAIKNICIALAPHLPTVNLQLQSYLTSSPCGRLATQSKAALPRLGHRGLLMVKLIESIVRLGNSDIDKLLCDTRVLSSSVELIFTFKFNSLLHLTVQRIVLMVVEGGLVRRTAQHSLLFEFGFLKKLMFELSNSNRVDTNSVSSSDITDDIEVVAQRARVEEEQWLLAGSRCPLLGHLVQIAQAIGTAYLGEELDSLVETRVINIARKDPHPMSDLDSAAGGCTPPVSLEVESSESIDSLSSALLKALTDFSSAKGADTEKDDDKEVSLADTVVSTPNLVDNNIIVSVAVVEDIVDDKLIHNIENDGLDNKEVLEGKDGEDGQDLDVKTSCIEISTENILPSNFSSEDNVINEGFTQSAENLHPLGCNFRSLFSENKMALEWENFELDVLRDIIDSQSTFHVTMDRNEDDFGSLSLNGQMDGSSSSFDRINSRQQQGADSSSETASSGWRHRNQMQINGTDESQFSLEQDDDDDDDDDDDLDNNMSGHYNYSHHFGEDINGTSDFANFEDTAYPIQNGFNFAEEEDSSQGKVDDFADFGNADFEPSPDQITSPPDSPPTPKDIVTFDDFADFDTLNFQTES
eukprot:CAMPEP_0119037278 /NCGR_PEP_ID=MMETSP1177-20130426/5549_1 /TAXON_ID=2985 /ORGANISM="Ochromonas sp, Strain CCMP1899" /LENGTH=785 /DNA_ID=CAMNT_0006998337 /DNA_START=631 /DNA_END=2988 /DNA_ORIENTATION=-